MDKHWKDVKVGDIIEVTYEENFKVYYKLCEGEFNIGSFNFYGKYFKTLIDTINDEQIENMPLPISGYETLRHYPYKIIDKLPDNIII